MVNIAKKYEVLIGAYPRDVQNNIDSIKKQIKDDPDYKKTYEKGLVWGETLDEFAEYVGMTVGAATSATPLTLQKIFLIDTYALGRKRQSSKKMFKSKKYMKKKRTMALKRAQSVFNHCLQAEYLKNDPVNKTLVCISYEGRKFSTMGGLVNYLFRELKESVLLLLGTFIGILLIVLVLLGRLGLLEAIKLIKDFVTSL